MLHNKKVLNEFQHSATLPGHEGSFKCHKNAFLNDPRAKKEVICHFRDFVLLDRLDDAYCDGTKCFSGFGNLIWS